MKTLNKTVTLILSFAVVSLVTACENREVRLENEYIATSSETTAYWKDGSEFQPVLRFAVGADTHVAREYMMAEKRVENLFEDAYRYAATQSYDKLDAVVFVGDVVEQGYESEYERLMNAWTKNIKPETQFLCLQAGHELINGTPEMHKEYTGNETMGIHVEINGFHFITVSNERWLRDDNGWLIYSYDNENGDTGFVYADEYDDYELSGNKFINSLGEVVYKNIKTVYDQNPQSECNLDWIEEQLIDADSDGEKPIFTFHHHPITDTIIDSQSNEPSWAIEPNFADLFKQYPNIIDFTGHHHTPNNHPRAIMQKDFTNVSAGALSYIGASSDLIGRSDAIARADDNVMGTGFWIVEVDAAGRVMLKPYNIALRTFFTEVGSGNEGKPLIRYIEKAWDKSTWEYTEERFNKADIPVWAEEAQISDIEFGTVKKWIYTGYEEERPTISFAFTPAYDQDGIECYRIKIKDKETGEYVKFFTKSNWSGTTPLDAEHAYWTSYYFQMVNFDRVYMTTSGISGMVSGKTYVIEIDAIDFYHKESQMKLTQDFIFE